MADHTALRVIPTLVYEDLEAAHDFLVEVFGLQPGGVQRDGEGRAVHAEVSAGDVTLWLHRHAPEHGLTSPRALDLVSSALVVLVDDVDAHYERAKAAGAAVDGPPADRDYGQREYGARDPEGGRWYFATPRP
jgi:uncharacterized glyoxalase superfamily protein PhnB